MLSQEEGKDKEIGFEGEQGRERKKKKQGQAVLRTRTCFTAREAPLGHMAAEGTQHMFPLGRPLACPHCLRQSQRLAQPLRPLQGLCYHPCLYITPPALPTAHILLCQRSCAAPQLWCGKNPQCSVAPQEDSQSSLWVTDATCLPEMFPALITFLNSTNTISAP